MSDNLYEQAQLENISLSDLEDIAFDTGSSAGLLDEESSSNTADYRRSGSFLDATLFEQYTKALLNESYRLMGQASSNNVLQTFYTRLDRNGNVLVPIPNLTPGYTFITRPRLNLSESSLCQTAFMSTLRSYDPDSIAFMIRALLDTKLCSGKGLDRYYADVGLTAEEIHFSDLARISALIDVTNPFLVPVCNALKGISGFPDFTIENETTDGDFHGGDFTFAKGSDMNKKTQELSLEFRDVHGSTILSLFYYWVMYIALQAKGLVVSYPDDIYEQRLNYTVSIYRFVTDPTKKQILWWSKATGCYPTSVPVGSIFNVSQDEVTLSSATNFSIPFKANVIEYNNPAIFEDFNTLVRRYCPQIISDDYIDLDYAYDEQGYPRLVNNGQEISYNYLGIPYVVSDKGFGLRLAWRAPAVEVNRFSNEAQSARLALIREAIELNRERRYAQALYGTNTGGNINVSE